MATFSIEERLRQLESRVNQLEARLGTMFQPVAPPPPAPPAYSVPPPVPRQEPAVLRQSPPIVAPIVAPVTWNTPVAPAASAPPFTPQPSSPPPRPRSAPPAPAIKPPSWRAMEQTIGLKWTGWVGAIVLVFGAAMGIQFAYEHHWFTYVPPALRLAAIFLAGFSLIGAGEFVYRRVHRIPAASLFGAGVATLFVGAYAGYAYFELYSRSTSMSLMAFSTLVGAAVAMRGNLVSIAALSLIGANVAPLLVASQNPPVTPFLFYLLSMELVALFLAQWGRGGKWWTLRGLSLCPAVLWMSGILSSVHGGETPVLVFMLVYAALYHAELVIAALRSDDNGPARHAPTTFAIFVTAALTLGVLTYFGDSTHFVRATWVLGLAAFSAALGFGLPRHRDSLRRLAIAHRIAAAALLVLAIPIATTGVRIEVGWAILAIGFAATWRLAGSRVSRIAAPVTWLLGIAHLALSILTNEHPFGPTWITFFGTAIGSTAILAWMLTLAGHLVATLVVGTDSKSWRNNSQVLSLLASALWIAAAIAGLPQLGATAWIIVYAWLLLGSSAAGAQPNLDISACGVLLLAIVKWAVLDTLAARLAPNWIHTRPVFNSLMGVGLLACGSLLGFYKLNRAAVRRVMRRGGDTNAPLWTLGLAAAVIGLVTIGFSFEIDRTITRMQADVWQGAMNPNLTEQLSWTILWSIAVCALLVVARAIAAPEVRGRWLNWLWILAGLLAAKFFIVDTFMQLFAGPAKVWPVLNLEVFAGAAVLAALALTRLLMSADIAEQSAGRDIRWRIGMLATMLIAWMGTLEIDRFVSQLGLAANSGDLDWHLKNLGWNIWWCVVISGSLLIWRRVDKIVKGELPWRHVLPALLSLIAAKYLAVDAIAWRFMHAPVSGWWVLVNFDVLTAAVVLGGILLPRLLAVNAGASQRRFEGALCLAILLIAGTLEVDRAFCLPSVRERLTDADLAEQVGFSIFWSGFAVAALAAGFWNRVAALRYFALGLLAATLLKVVLVDLSQIGYGYRVLSFIGLGLLLLFTSVMYGKISPLLLSRSLPDNEGRGT